MTTPYANTTVKSSQITLVASTATKLGTGASGVPMTNRVLVKVLNQDSALTVFIGATGDGANGWPIGPLSESDWIPMGSSVDLFGFSTGTPIVSVMELA